MGLLNAVLEVAACERGQRGHRRLQQLVLGPPMAPSAALAPTPGVHAFAPYHPELARAVALLGACPALTHVVLRLSEADGEVGEDAEAHGGALRALAAVAAAWRQLPGERRVATVTLDGLPALLLT